MRYDVRKLKYCVKLWKDKNRKRWPYLTEKEAEVQGIDLNNVFADVGSEKDYNGDCLFYAGRKLVLTDKREELKKSEKIYGYIPCMDEYGEEGYVRIVKKRKKWLALLLLLLLLIPLLFGVKYFIDQNKKVDLDEAAISYQMPNGVKNENPEEIMMPVFGELKMVEGTTEITAGLANPEGNPCYFKYSIVLKEGNKVLYESKWIEPGTAVVELNISEKLPKGSHPILIKIDTGTLADPEVAMNGGEIESVLKVE